MGDIHPIVSKNRAKVRKVAERVLDFCTGPRTFDEVIREAFVSYGLMMDFNQFVLVGRTVRSYISYLCDKGLVAARFEDNRLLWQRAAKIRLSNPLGLKKEDVPDGTSSFLARPRRFEPPTYRLGIWRTNSYTIRQPTSYIVKYYELFCILRTFTAYAHEHRPCDPHAGMLHWLHIMVSNAKAYIPGTCHGLPRENRQPYLDEFCFRFSRRAFGPALFDRLASAMMAPSMAD